MYKKHLFICESCIYVDENGETCDVDTARKFRKKVKNKAKAIWGNEVRVNGAKCLGKCEKGIASVIYPKGDWRVELRPGDEELLISDLNKAIEVENLEEAVEARGEELNKNRRSP